MYPLATCDRPIYSEIKSPLANQVLFSSYVVEISRLTKQ